MVMLKFVSGVPDGMIETGVSPAVTGNHALVRNRVRRQLRAAMPPVAGFPIVSAEAVRNLIVDEDHVLGIELSGESRAYAINMMGKPESELLNDTIAGLPIAITFCSNCQSPVVFSRRIAAKTLTLHLSGELLAENMIMRDVETGSVWVQLTGEAIEGPLEGQRLEQIPLVWTDWKTWRKRHPETTVPELPNVVQTYRHQPLYSASLTERMFFSGIQLGLTHGEQAKSWPYAQLDRQPVVNDVFSGQPLLIVFDKHTSTAKVYNRRPGDVELTFRWQANQLTDDQTNSTWDHITGRASSGRMKGQRLTPVAGIVSNSRAWRSFHPKSEAWSAEEVQTR
jgi:hypothetical protein